MKTHEETNAVSSTSNRKTLSKTNETDHFKFRTGIKTGGGTGDVDMLNWTSVDNAPENIQ